jgi:hypothetical protein
MPEPAHQSVAEVRRICGGGDLGIESWPYTALF